MNSMPRQRLQSMDGKKQLASEVSLESSNDMAAVNIEMGTYTRGSPRIMATNHQPQQVSAALPTHETYPLWERRKRKSSDGHRGTRQCIQCSALSSLSVLVVGSVLLLRSNLSAEQAAEMAPIQRAVAEWNEVYAEEFAATTWVLRVNETLELPMDPRHDELPETVRVMSGMPRYDSMVFYVRGLLLNVFHPPSKTKAEEAETREAEANATDDANGDIVMQESLEPVRMQLQVTEGGQSTVIDLGKVPLVRRRMRAMHNWKVCVHHEHGRLTRGQCVTYSFANKLCLKVRRDKETQRWEADNTFGGQGCSPYNQWELATWQRLRLPAHGDLLPFITTQQENSSGFTIRHSADPLLLLRNNTKGTMRIAETNVNP